jgi:hypothetical protein
MADNNTQQVVPTQEDPPKDKITPFASSIANGATVGDMQYSKDPIGLEKFEDYSKFVKSKNPNITDDVLQKTYGEAVKLYDGYKSSENYLQNMYIPFQTTNTPLKYVTNKKVPAITSPKPQTGEYFDVALGPVQKFHQEEVAKSSGIWKKDGQYFSGAPQSSILNGEIPVTVWDEDRQSFITEVMPLNVMQPTQSVQSFFGTRRMEGSLLGSLLKGVLDGAVSKMATGLLSPLAVMEDFAYSISGQERTPEGWYFNQANNAVTNLFSGTLAKHQNEEEGAFDNLNSFLYSFGDGIGQIASLSKFAQASYGGRMSMINSMKRGLDSSKNLAANFAMQSSLFVGGFQAGGMMRNMAIQQGVDPKITSLMFIPWAAATYASERIFMANVYLRDAIGMDKFNTQWTKAYNQLAGPKRAISTLPFAQRKAGDNILKSFYYSLDNSLRKMGEHKWGKYVAMGLEEGVEELAEGFMDYPIDIALNSLAESQGEATLAMYGNHKFNSVLLPDGTTEYQRESPIGNKERLPYNIWKTSKEDVDNALRWRAGEKPLQPEFWNWEEAAMAGLSAPFGGMLSNLGMKGHGSKKNNEQKLFAQQYVQNILTQVKDGNYEPAIEALRQEMLDAKKIDPNIFGPGIVVDGKEVADAHINMFVDEVQLLIKRAVENNFSQAESLMTSMVGTTLMEEAFGLVETKDTLKGIKDKLEKGEELTPEEIEVSTIKKEQSVEEQTGTIDKQIQALDAKIAKYVQPESATKKTSIMYSYRILDEKVFKIYAENRVKGQLEEDYRKKMPKGLSSEQKAKYLKGIDGYVNKHLADSTEIYIKNIIQKRTFRDLLDLVEIQSQLGSFSGAAYKQGYTSPSEHYVHTSNGHEAGIKYAVEKYNEVLDQQEQILDNQLDKNIDTQLAKHTASLKSITDKGTNLTSLQTNLTQINKSIQNVIKASQVISNEARVTELNDYIGKIRSEYKQFSEAVLNYYTEGENIGEDYDFYDFMPDENWGQKYEKSKRLTFENYNEDPTIGKQIRNDGIKALHFDRWATTQTGKNGQQEQVPVNIRQTLNDYYENIVEKGLPPTENIEKVINNLIQFRRILNENVKGYLNFTDFIDTLKGTKDEEHNPNRLLSNTNILFPEERTMLLDETNAIIEKISEIELSESLQAYNKEKSNWKADIKSTLIKAQLTLDYGTNIDELAEYLLSLKKLSFGNREIKNVDLTVDRSTEDWMLIGAYLFSSLDNKKHLIELSRLILKSLDSTTSKEKINNDLKGLYEELEANKDINKGKNSMPYNSLNEYMENGAINIKNSVDYYDNIGNYVMDPGALMNSKTNPREYFAHRFALLNQLYRLANASTPLKYSDIYRAVKDHLIEVRENKLPYSVEQIDVIMHGVIFAINPQDITVNNKNISQVMTEKNEDKRSLTENIFGITGIGGAGKSSIILDIFEIYRKISGLEKLNITIISPTVALNNEHKNRAIVFPNLNITTKTVHEAFIKEANNTSALDDIIIFDEATAVDQFILKEGKEINNIKKAGILQIAQEKRKAGKTELIYLLGDSSQVASISFNDNFIAEVSKDRSTALKNAHRVGNPYTIEFQESFTPLFKHGIPQTNNNAIIPDGHFQGNTIIGTNIREGVFMKNTLDEVINNFYDAVNTPGNDAVLIFQTEQQRESFLSDENNRARFTSFSERLKVLRLDETLEKNNMVSGLSANMVFFAYDPYAFLSNDKPKVENYAITDEKLSIGRAGYTASTRTKEAGFIMFYTANSKMMADRFTEVKIEESKYVPVNKDTLNEKVNTLVKDMSDILGDDISIPKPPPVRVKSNRTALLFKPEDTEKAQEIVNENHKTNKGNNYEPTEGAVRASTLVPTKVVSKSTDIILTQEIDTKLQQVIDAWVNQNASPLADIYGTNFWRHTLSATIDGQKYEGHPFLVKVIGQKEVDKKIIPIVDIYIRKVGIGAFKTLTQYDKELLTIYAALAQKQGYAVNNLSVVQFVKGELTEIGYYYPANNGIMTMTDTEISETYTTLKTNQNTKTLFDTINNVGDLIIDESDFYINKRIQTTNPNIALGIRYINTKDGADVVITEQNSTFFEQGEKRLPWIAFDDKEMTVEEFGKIYKRGGTGSQFKEFSEIWNNGNNNVMPLYGSHIPLVFENDTQIFTTKNSYIVRKQMIASEIKKLINEDIPVPVIVSYIAKTNLLDANGTLEKDIEHVLQVELDRITINNYVDVRATSFRTLKGLLELGDLSTLGITDSDVNILGYVPTVETDYEKREERSNGEVKKNAIKLSATDIGNYINDINPKEVTDKIEFKNALGEDDFQGQNIAFNIDKLKFIKSLANNPNKKISTTLKSVENGYAFYDYKNEAITLNSLLFQERLSQSGFKLVSDELKVQQKYLRSKKLEYYVKVERVNDPTTIVQIKVEPKIIETNKIIQFINNVTDKYIEEIEKQIKNELNKLKQEQKITKSDIYRETYKSIEQTEMYKFLAMNMNSLEKFIPKGSEARVFFQIVTNTKTNYNNLKIWGYDSKSLTTSMKKILGELNKSLDDIEAKSDVPILFENVYGTVGVIETENFTTKMKFITQPNYSVSKNENIDINNKDYVEPDFEDQGFYGDNDTLVVSTPNLIQNEVEVREQIQSVIGKRNSEFVDVFSNLIMKYGDNARLMGMLEDMRIKLYGINGMFQENVGRHEGMHFVLRHLLTSNELQKVLEEATIEMEAKNYKGSVHEFIADSFQNQKISNKPKSFFRKFVDAFKRFLNWVGLYNYGFNEFLKMAEVGYYSKRTAHSAIYDPDLMKVKNIYNSQAVNKKVEDAFPTSDIMQIAKYEVRRHVNMFLKSSKNVESRGFDLVTAISHAYKVLNDKAEKVRYEKFGPNDLQLRGETQMSYQDVRDLITNNIIGLNLNSKYASVAMMDKDIFNNIVQQVYEGLDVENNKIFGTPVIYGEDNESKNAYAGMNSDVENALTNIPMLVPALNKQKEEIENTYNLRGSVPFGDVNQIFQRIVEKISNHKNAYDITFSDILVVLEEMQRGSIKSTGNKATNSKMRRDIYLSILVEFGNRYVNSNTISSEKLMGKRFLVENMNENYLSNYSRNIKSKLVAWKNLENAIASVYRTGKSKTFYKANNETKVLQSQGTRTENDLKKKIQDSLQSKFFTHTGQITKEAIRISSMYDFTVNAKNRQEEAFIITQDGEKTTRVITESVADIRKMMQDLGVPFQDKIGFSDLYERKDYRDNLVTMLKSLKYNVLLIEELEKLDVDKRVAAIKEKTKFIMTSGNRDLIYLHKNITSGKEIKGAEEIRSGMVEGEENSNMLLNTMKPHNYYDFIAELGKDIFEYINISDSVVTLFAGRTFNNHNMTSPFDIAMGNMDTIDNKRNEVLTALEQGIETPLAEIKKDGTIKYNNALLKDNGLKAFIQEYGTLIGAEENNKENVTKDLTMSDFMTTIFETTFFGNLKQGKHDRMSVLLNPFSDKSRRELMKFSINEGQSEFSQLNKVINDSNFNTNKFIDITQTIVDYYSKFSAQRENALLTTLKSLGIKIDSKNYSNGVKIDSAQVKAIESSSLRRNTDYIINTLNGVSYLSAGNAIVLRNTLFNHKFINDWNTKNKGEVFNNLIQEQSKDLIKYMSDIDYTPSEYVKNYYKIDNTKEVVPFNEKHPLIQSFVASTLLFNESFSHIQRAPITNFKNIVDFIKRSAKDIAPMIPITPTKGGMNSTFNVMHIEDLGATLKSYNNEYNDELASNGMGYLNLISMRKMQISEGGEYGRIHFGAIKTVITVFDSVTARSYYIKHGSVTATENEIFNKRSKFWIDMNKFMLGENVWNRIVELYKEKKDLMSALDTVIAEIDEQGIVTIDLLAPSSSVKIEQSNKVFWNNTNGEVLTRDNAVLPLEQREELLNQKLVLPTSSLGLQSLTQKRADEKQKVLATQLTRIIKLFKNNASRADSIDRILTQNIELAATTFLDLTKKGKEKEFKAFLNQLAKEKVSKDNIQRRDLVAQSSVTPLDAATTKHIENIISYFNDAYKLTMTGFDGVQIPSYNNYYFDNTTGSVHTAAELDPTGNTLTDDSVGMDGYTRRKINTRHYEDTNNIWLTVDDLNQVKTKGLESLLNSGIKYVPEEVAIDFPFRNRFGMNTNTSLNEAMTIVTNAGSRNMYQAWNKRLSREELQSQFINIAIQNNIRTSDKLFTIIPNEGIRNYIISQYEKNKRQIVKGTEHTIPVLFNVALETVIDYYQTLNEALDVLVVRVPTTGSETASIGRIIHFNNGMENAVELAPEKNTHDGSDYDNDPIQMYFRTISNDGRIDRTSEKGDGLSNQLFDVFQGYYNDLENSGLILSKTNTEFTKAFLEDTGKDDAKEFPDTMSTPTSIMKAISITDSGKGIVGHFANMMVFLSELFSLNPTAMVNGLDESLQMYDKDGNYIERSQEVLLAVIQAVGEYLNLATDNVKESGALGRLNISEINTNLISGLLLMSKNDNPATIRENILNSLKDDVIIEAMRIVNNSHNMNSNKRITLKDAIGIAAKEIREDNTLELEDVRGTLGDMIKAKKEQIQGTEDKNEIKSLNKELRALESQYVNDDFIKEQVQSNMKIVMENVLKNYIGYKDAQKYKQDNDIKTLTESIVGLKAEYDALINTGQVNDEMAFTINEKIAELEKIQSKNYTSQTDYKAKLQGFINSTDIVKTIYESLKSLEGIGNLEIYRMYVYKNLENSINKAKKNKTEINEMVDGLTKFMGFGETADYKNHANNFKNFFRRLSSKLNIDESLGENIIKYQEASLLGEQLQRFGEFAKMLKGIDGRVESLQLLIRNIEEATGFNTIEDLVNYINKPFVSHTVGNQMANLSIKYYTNKSDDSKRDEIFKRSHINIANIVHNYSLYRSYVNSLYAQKLAIEKNFHEFANKELRNAIVDTTGIPYNDETFQRLNNAVSKVYDGNIIRALSESIDYDKLNLKIAENEIYRASTGTAIEIDKFVNSFPETHKLIMQNLGDKAGRFLRELSVTTTQQGYPQMQIYNSKFIEQDTKFILRESFARLPIDIQKLYSLYHLIVYGNSTSNGTYKEFIQVGNTETGFESLYKEENIKKYDVKIEKDLSENLMTEILLYNHQFKLTDYKTKSELKDDSNNKYTRIRQKKGRILGLAVTKDEKTNFYYPTMPLRNNPHGLNTDKNISKSMSKYIYFPLSKESLDILKDKGEVVIDSYNKNLSVIAKGNSERYTTVGDIVMTSAGTAKVISGIQSEYEAIENGAKVTKKANSMQSVTLKLQEDVSTKQLRSKTNKLFANNVIETFMSILQDTFPNIKFIADDTIEGIGEITNGIYYYNPNLVTLENQLHESGHIYTLLMKESNPLLYERVMEQANKMVDENHPIVQFIKSQAGYDGYQGDKLLHEVIATMIGLNTQDRVNAFIEKNLVGDQSFINRMFTGIKNIIGRITNFINGLLKGIGLVSNVNSSIDELGLDMVNLILNKKVKLEIDTERLQHLMLMSGYKEIHQLSNAKINNFKDLNASLSPQNIIPESLKITELKEINLTISALEQMEEPYYTLPNGDKVDFTRKPRTEWANIIAKIIKQRTEEEIKNSPFDITLKSLKAGGTITDFRANVPKNTQGDYLYDLEALNRLRRIMMRSTFAVPEYYSYKELKESEDKVLRDLYDETLDTNDIIVSVYKNKVDNKDKYNISLYQITNKRFFDEEIIKVHGVLDLFESPMSHASKGIELKSIYKDLSHIKLTLLANKIAESNRNIGIDDVNIIQLYPNSTPVVSWTERQHYTEQLHNMLKSTSFKEKLSPEMLKLFSSTAYRDSNYSYGDVLNAVYNEAYKNRKDNLEEKAVRFTIEGQVVENFDGLSNHDKITVCRQRLSKIYSEMDNKKISDRENHEILFLIKTIFALDNNGLPQERMNRMKDLQTINNMTATQYAVPHEVLSRITDATEQSHMSVVQQILNFNKNGFTDFVKYFRQDVKFEVVDSSYKAYDKLYVYENAKDMQGNNVKVWTGRVAWTTDEKLDPVGYKYAQELNKTTEGKEILKKGAWLVNQITNMYAKMIVHKKHQYGLPYTIEQAIKELGENKNIYNYNPGTIPWMYQTVTEKMGKFHIKDAINLTVEQTANAMESFENLMGIYDNKSGTDFLDEMPDAFFKQIYTGSTETLNKTKYGKRSDIKKHLGLGFDETTNDLILLDPKRQDLISKDLEVIMKMFVLSMERKMEYEENVLPVINGARSLLNRMNEIYEGDEIFDQKNSLEYLDSYVRSTILGKRFQIKSAKADKIITNVSNTTSAFVMFANLNVGILSLVHNGMTAFIEGIAGSVIQMIQQNKEGLYFNVGDLIAASGDVLKNYNLLSQLGMENQIFNSTDYEMATHQVHQVGKKHFIGSHMANYFNWAADYYARGVVMAAYMRNQGMRDSVSLNEKGELVYDITKDRRYYGKDGISQTPEQIARLALAKNEMLESGFINNIDDAITKPFFFKEIRVIKTIASNYVTGAYSRNEKNLMGTWLVGKLFNTFKTFFMTKFNNAVQQGTYSEGLGYVDYFKDEEGNTVAKWKRVYMEGYFRTMMNAGRDLFVKDQKVFSKEYWTQSPHKARNLARFMTTWLVWMASMLLWSLLTGDKDDDKPILRTRLVKNFFYASDSILVIPTLLRMIGKDSTFAAFSIMNRFIEGIFEMNFKKIRASLPLNSLVSTSQDIKTMVDYYGEEEKE